MKDMTGPIDGYRGIAGALVPTVGNGGFLAGTRRIDGGVGQVKVWRLGSPEPSIKFDFNDDYRRPFGPLAFSPDGIDLYVVTGSPPSSVVVFRVLDPTVQPSHVFAELTDRTIKAGQTTQIDVHLDTPGTNRDVTLLAAPWQGLGGGAWQVVATRTVDADGNAEFTVTADRHTDYDVEYAGDADTAPSGYGAMTVFVEAAISGEMQGAFEVVNGVAHYHDADAVVYAMHAEPSDIQLFFHAHVEYNNNGAWTPLMTKDVTGTGDATATFDADVLGPGHYRVSASSSGSIVVYNGESGWTRFAIES